MPQGLFGKQLTANHGQANLYGIDPVRLFGEAYLPNIGEGTNIKVGRFYAQFGVEAIDAPGNSLLSHSYTFIYNPFTQIGAVGTTKLNDRWTTQLGLTSGSDFFTSPASAAGTRSGFFQSPTFIGSLKWAPPGGQDDIKYAVIIGSGRYDRSLGANNVNVFNLVWNHQFNSKLKYTLNQLYGYEQAVPIYGDSNWLSFVQYLTYKFHSKLSGAVRLEFYDDFQGQRTGHRGLYTDITGGLQFAPTARFTIRPELRFDHNSQTRPFENHPDLFTAATDVIVRW